jgi:hypothetical protein
MERPARVFSNSCNPPFITRLKPENSDRERNQIRETRDPAIKVPTTDIITRVNPENRCSEFQTPDRFLQYAQQRRV